MKVVVCVKQTPSTTAVFTVENGQVSWDDPGGKPLVLNPWDEYAVEEALRLQEENGGDAVALTVGPEASQEALKTCLAMGCGEAVQVWDDSFSGSDSLGTARILAATINKVSDVDLAIFGRQAIDGDTGQTIVQTAQKLGWTPLTFVSKIEEVDFDAGTVTVERQVDDSREKASAKLPVVISVVKEIGEPRYPSFMGIRKANRATIPVWSASDLEIDGEVGAGAARVDWTNIYGLPPRDTSVEFIDGETAEEIAKNLADRLFEEKVL